MNRIHGIFESLDDTQKLISSDLFQNSMAFYRSLKVASQQNVPGSSYVMEDLKLQFPGAGSAAKNKNGSLPVDPVQ